jgi:hypothetical protein
LGGGLRTSYVELRPECRVDPWIEQIAILTPSINELKRYGRRSDSSEPRTASFVRDESYDQPGMLPEVRVRGGRIEELRLALVE